MSDKNKKNNSTKESLPFSYMDGARMSRMIQMRTSHRELAAQKWEEDGDETGGGRILTLLEM